MLVYEWRVSSPKLHWHRELRPKYRPGLNELIRTSPFTKKVQNEDFHIVVLCKFQRFILKPISVDTPQYLLFTKEIKKITTRHVENHHRDFPTITVLLIIDLICHFHIPYIYLAKYFGNFKANLIPIFQFPQNENYNPANFCRHFNSTSFAEIK
jgi:hypothetical protein